MCIPYTYCITHLPSRKRYYGARWAKNCHPEDLWNTYFTSSTHIKDLIMKDGKDSFFTEVRRIFVDVESCRNWEQKVLQRLKVTVNESWINKNINGRFLPYGKQSEQHINKRKKFGSEHHAFGKPGTMLDKKHTPEALKKLKRPKSKTDLYAGRPQNINLLECNHCGIKTNIGNHKRWHGDNCRNQSHRDW